MSEIKKRIFNLSYKLECQNLGTASAHEVSDLYTALHTEFCLKSGIGNYRAEKPIAKAFMTDVKFDMENMITTREPGPEVGKSTVLPYRPCYRIVK